ncbi:MAG: hypothetical protein KDB65_09200 [Calditrichaeota bacterium]|nr:hypothetical protein [Calditrichota bacterium]
MLAAFELKTAILFIALFAASVFPALSQTKILTDYEWQLSEPGRTMFRDRLPVGQIALVEGRKEKLTGELLQVLTDIAFIPGDSLRHFAAAFRIFEGERVYSEVIADAEELPELIGAAKYIAETAVNIASTERSETRITFRTRANLSLEFIQIGTQQQINIVMPDPLSDGEIIRTLSADQLKLFSDLLDLTIFELNRQGANLVVETPK